MVSNKHILNMTMAVLASYSSTCQRRKVGALLVLEGRIISSGFNGSLPGETHCNPEECNANSPCLKTVHAEQNIIAFCAKHGLSTNGATLYVTLSPCKECAKIILQAGIKEVLYYESYRDHSGIETLRSHGVKVDHIAPYIIKPQVDVIH